jgi:NAD-dependent dihydropyrimidine dehydrogenase PreA subunit
MTYLASRVAYSVTAVWLVNLAGCAGQAGRERVPAPRHTAYYVADTDSRPGNPMRRADAIRSIERACPRGYHIEGERRPGQRRRTGVIEYTCIGEGPPPLRPGGPG